MDSDSFLSLLFPELNDLADSEISEYWCPDEDDDDRRHPPLPSPQTLTLNPPPSSDLHLSHHRPDSSLISSITENAAHYSPILKLSAIASALPSFSSKLPAADLRRGAADGDRSGHGAPAPAAEMKRSSSAAAMATVAQKHAEGGNAAGEVLKRSASAAAIAREKQGDGAGMRGSNGGNQRCREREMGGLAAGMKRSASAAAMAAQDEEGKWAAEMGDLNRSGGGRETDELAAAPLEEQEDGGESAEQEEEEDEEEEEEEDSELDYGYGGIEIVNSDEKPVSHVRIIRRPACSQVISAAPLTKRGADHRINGSNEAASSISDTDQGLAMKKDHPLSQREVHILSERRRRKSMRESFAVLQSLIPNLKLKNIDRITVLTEVISYIQSLRGTLEELERRKADIMGFLGVATAEEENGRDAMATTRQNPAAMSKKRGSCDVTYVEDEEDVKMYSEAAQGRGSYNGGGNYGGGGGGGGNHRNVAMVEVTVRLCADDIFITLNIPRRKGVWSGVLLLLQKWTVELSNATLTTTADSSFHCIHGKITNKASIEGIDLQEKIERVIIKELRKRPKKILKA